MTIEIRRLRPHISGVDIWLMDGRVVCAWDRPAWGVEEFHPQRPGERDPGGWKNVAPLPPAADTARDELVRRPTAAAALRLVEQLEACGATSPPSN